MSIARAYEVTLPFATMFGAMIGVALWMVFRRFQPPRQRFFVFAANVLWHSCNAFIIASCLAVVCVALACRLFYSPAPRPSDEMYIATFPQNRRALEEIVNLLSADNRLGDIRTDVPWQAAEPGGVEHPKEARYRELLQSVGAIQATVGLDSEIEIRESSDGWLMSDYDDTGYCYAPSPSEPVLLSLDGLKKPYSVNYSAVRPITGKWYVYYRHMSGD